MSTQAGHRKRAMRRTRAGFIGLLAFALVTFSQAASAARGSTRLTAPSDERHSRRFRGSASRFLLPPGVLPMPWRGSETVIDAETAPAAVEPLGE
jgi:hypothetical protein